MTERLYTDAPICNSEAARAAGLDIAPTPSEMTTMADLIVSSRDGDPVPEVDLARAVPLMVNEIERLRRKIEALELAEGLARAAEDDAKAERDEAQKRLHNAAMTRTWTNEDGKKFVFVEDIAPNLFGTATAERGESR